MASGRCFTMGCRASLEGRVRRRPEREGRNDRPASNFFWNELTDNKPAWIEDTLHSTSTILVVMDDVADESRLVERLQREPGLVLIGVAASCDDAISMLIRVAPDLVLLDLDLRGGSGLDAARQILQVRPKSRILLTGELDAQDISRARELRIRGVVAKSEGVDKVAAAVRRIADGETCFPKVERRRSDDESPDESIETGAERLSTLTPRELEVLKLIATGLPQKRIAERLSISIKTVDNHRSNLMKKLGIHDRVRLARFAIRERLVDA